MLHRFEDMLACRKVNGQRTDGRPLRFLPTLHRLLEALGLPGVAPAGGTWRRVA